MYSRIQFAKCYFFHNAMLTHDIHNVWFFANPLEHLLKYKIVTYKSTDARTVICRQDGRGRFPVCWTISPNVGQIRKENPNLVRILYLKLIWNDIYKQYNKLHNIDTQKSVHFAVPRTETRLKNASDLQALYSPQRCELIKKKQKKKKNTKLFL